MKILLFVIGLGVCAGCFAGGVFYAKASRLDVPRFKLAKHVKIQDDHGIEAQLPAGTSFYEFSRSGDRATFFVLVDVAPGFLDLLEPINDARVTAGPMQVYPPK